MTSIERTAYPYICASKSISKKTLESCYTLTEEELSYIGKYIRGNRLSLNFAIQLKTFQNLGYFVDISDVPQLILNHLKKQMGVPHNLKSGYEHQKTLSRHRISIRNYLKVMPWSRQGRRIALQAAYNASQTMNNPADIINIVIEDLIAKHYELPAYNTLDRLVQHTRATVNRGIFQKVTHILKDKDLLKILDQLLIIKDHESYSDYQKLKQSPKAPTITNFKELIRHHSWLISLGDMIPYLQEITKVKLKQFAEEAKSLDVSNLKDLSDAKRYTLIACLIYQAQQLTKEALATLFCKTLSSIHKRAKRELDVLRKQFADKTQDLAYLMLGMVGDFKDYTCKPKIFTTYFKEKLEAQGGAEQIMDICQTIIAYNSKNHLPLLWGYFQSKRSALFDLLDTIHLGSSTQNSSLLNALSFLIENRHKRTESLSPDINLDFSFASEAWKDFVYIGKREQNFINRRYFELCVYSYLANELRSGDLFIEGADSFSDYRQHLLSWAECGLLVETYLHELGLPKTAEEFVAYLKNSLSQMAKKVDKIYPRLPDFMIDEAGIPILKKMPTIKPSKKTLKLVEKIHKRMPERSLLDVLCLTHHLTGWAHEFGHISGADNRLDNAVERYILNAFCQGTGMGPSQGAKHIRANITPHMLSWINRRHVTPKQLDKAKDRIINYSQEFPLTTAWGDGRRCAADGTLRNIYEDNLLVESHIRYNAKGGIA